MNTGSLEITNMVMSSRVENEDFYPLANQAKFPNFKSRHSSNLVGCGNDIHVHTHTYTCTYSHSMKAEEISTCKNDHNILPTHQ